MFGRFLERVVCTVEFYFSALDDLRRHRRDKEVNGQKYKRLLREAPYYEYVPSSKLQVGDMVNIK